ncbi:MAG: Gfo/Idh/MocA family oxidoreductase [Planctomycetota bacterium]|nr:Gfo/Idh/MocA family oxidoreductase [Planctomycetota bacterium]
MSTKRKLRAVQVGCGGRAQTHIKAMIACGEVELLAICDIDAAKLKATAEKYNIPKTYASMEEMIQKEQPEFVDICTPPTIRTSIVEPAIKAGAPAVLIEKPIALLPSESRRLVELGKDRLICVNTQYQWMSHWQRIWGLLQEKALGEVRLLRASCGVNILEQGPHDLDLALKAARISGLPAPEWVVAQCWGIERFGKTPVPHDTAATVGLGDARLHFNAGPSAPNVPGESAIYLQQQVEIIGSKGRIWVSLNKGGSIWIDGKHEEIDTNWPRGDAESQPALYVSIRDALHNNTWKEFPTRVEISAQVSDVMFGCYASALGGGKVKLPQEFPDSLVDQLEKLPQK